MKIAISVRVRNGQTPPPPLRKSSVNGPLNDRAGLSKQNTGNQKKKGEVAVTPNTISEHIGLMGNKAVSIKTKQYHSLKRDR